MNRDLLSTSQVYDFILSEGELRQILSQIEALRQEENKPFCLRLHLEPALGGMLSHNSIEPLTQEMIQGIREKGEIDF